MDPAVLAAVVATLAKAAPDAEQILLFGSHARGEADAGSDLDFLVIESTVENRAHEMVRLRRALRPLRVPVDVLVYSRAEVNQWGHQPGTALYWALREGRVVMDEPLSGGAVYALLLASARQDFAACQLLSKGVGIGDAVVGFHAQQALEKSLKAVLSARMIEFRRTHDLVSLLDLLHDNKVPMPPAADWLDELNLRDGSPIRNDCSRRA